MCSPIFVGWFSLVWFSLMCQQIASCLWVVDLLLCVQISLSPQYSSKKFFFTLCLDDFLCYYLLNNARRMPVCIALYNFVWSCVSPFHSLPNSSSLMMWMDASERCDELWWFWCDFQWLATCGAYACQPTCFIFVEWLFLLFFSLCVTLLWFVQKIK